jgi:hypothetical protein
MSNYSVMEFQCDRFDVAKELEKDLGLSTRAANRHRAALDLRLQ